MIPLSMAFVRPEGWIPGGFFPQGRGFGHERQCPDPNTSNAVIQGLLADMTAKLVTAQEEIAVLTKEKGELSQEVSAKQTEITGLQTKIQTFPALRSRTGEKAPSMHVWNRMLKILL